MFKYNNFLFIFDKVKFKIKLYLKYRMIRKNKMILLSRNDNF